MVFKVIWYLVSLTFLNNFLCIQTWILTKASWNKTRNSSCSVSGVCCELTVHEVCRKCSNSITNILHLFKIIVCKLSPSVKRESAQTSVSLRSRSIRCMLFSMAVRFVIWVAQLAGNQPLSPSLIRSPWHQPTAKQRLIHLVNSYPKQLKRKPKKGHGRGYVNSSEVTLITVL